MRKKILFVINTMGRAGAETALLELLKALAGQDLELSLYVILGQGEMIEKLPSGVRLLNRKFDTRSVLSREGKLGMAGTVCKAFFRNGKWVKKIRCIIKIYAEMRKKGKLQTDKLLWRMLSDGSPRFGEHFDLAVAWLEGASAYYVADYVNAARKCAFIHIDYESAGYTREMDQNCWENFDRIYMVSDEVKEHFLTVYPQYGEKAAIFHNRVDQERIRRMAGEKGGFSDGYEGLRLLTVGRLTYQKAYDVAIEAMRLLKDKGWRVRWYVLGEGDQRRSLEKKIHALGLEEDFVLLGAVENPYPYYAQADLYLHATRFEGKSIAIQEAQTLGCAVIASDCNGNREQIEEGVDGMLCALTPQGIAESAAMLLSDGERKKALGRAAARKDMNQGRELEEFLKLLE